MYLYRIYNSFRNCAKGTFIFTTSLIFTLHTIPSSLVALKASACGGEYIVYNILYLDDYPFLKCMFVVFHYRRKSLTVSNVSPLSCTFGIGYKNLYGGNYWRYQCLLNFTWLFSGQKVHAVSVDKWSMQMTNGQHKFQQNWWNLLKLLLFFWGRSTNNSSLIGDQLQGSTAVFVNSNDRFKLTTCIRLISAMHLLLRHFR